MTRYAARSDANQAEVVKALRGVGASVQTLHRVGQGCPDLLVGYRGQTMLMEVKDGRKPPSERQLTPDQIEWRDGWRGQWALVNSADDALGMLGILRKDPTHGD